MEEEIEDEYYEEEYDSGGWIIYVVIKNIEWVRTVT